MLEYHKKDWGADFESKRVEIMKSVSSDFFTWDENGDKKVSRDELTHFWTNHQDLIEFVKF